MMLLCPPITRPSAARVRPIEKGPDMKRTKFSDEQIIGILREQEAGTKTGDLCRRPSV